MRASSGLGSGGAWKLVIDVEITRRYLPVIGVT